MNDEIRMAAQEEALRRWPIVSREGSEPFMFTKRELDAYQASAFLAGALWAASNDSETR